MKVGADHPDLFTAQALAQDLQHAETIKKVLQDLVRRSEVFVITTDYGYSGRVETANHILVEEDDVVVRDAQGVFEFIPFRHISRISNKNGDTLVDAGDM